MANGGRQPSIKIDIPLDPVMLAQNLQGFGIGGNFGGQPIGTGTVLAPEEVQQNQLTPDIVDNPPQPVAPSANLPQAPAPQALPPPQQVGAANILQQQLNDPNKQALIAQLQEAFQSTQEDRQGSIEGLEKILLQETNRKPDKVRAVQRAAALFSDAFFETDLAKNVPGLETPEKRANRLSLLQRAISQEKGALNKAQVDALKSALGGASNTRILQALGRDERFNKSQAKSLKLDFFRRKEKLGNQVLKFGLPGLNTTLDKMDKVLPGGIAGFDSAKDNIPGVGGGEGFVPTGRLSKQGAEMRQLALGLGNQILKLRSGAQINENEAVRILGELGIDQSIGEGGGIKLIFRGTRSDDDFINGVRLAEEALDRTENVLKASFGEDAFKAVSPSFIKRKKGVRRKSEIEQLQDTIENLESQRQ